MKFKSFHLITLTIILLSMLSTIPIISNESFSHPRLRTAAGTSSNWSGYVVQSSMTSPISGFITSVVGTWKIPELNSSASQNAYVAMWVGIDGYSSETVEQIGTEQDIVNGVQQNYAWIELYPEAPKIISSITVNTGDILTASVTYQMATGSYVFSLEDLTTGQSYSKSHKTIAQRQSAEWIVEAPSSSATGGVLPLADFGEVSFRNSQYRDNIGSAYAIDGGGVGTYEKISMDNPLGGSATPSDLAYNTEQNSSDFNVTYSPDTLALQHDVAITAVTLSKTIVGQGYNLRINATATNVGDYTETFNVTAYADSATRPIQHLIIGIKTVPPLAPGASYILSYSWNTTNMAIGNYTILLSATPVWAEVTVRNNFLRSGMVNLTKKGDIDGDKRINVLDLITIASCLGTIPTDAKWNPNADINDDRILDTIDLMVISQYVGT